jgi:hypothetical protein
MIHDAEIREIARDVACYLCQNPDACDGVEGISRWWLTPGHVHTDAQVQRALALLVGEELLKVTRAGDGRVRYAMREGCVPALEALCRICERRA